MHFPMVGPQEIPTTGAPPPSTTDEPPPYVDRDTLPQPITAREPIEHVYSLKDNNKVRLKLYSRAKSPKSLPLYFEREKICGSLEINAEKGDSIHSITAKVVGRITTGARTDDTLTFLSQSLCIWAKSPDLPRIVSSPSPGTSGSKLLGHCEWPLSIPLPTAVSVPSLPGKSAQKYRLPETFSERQINASVQYEFIIVIGRGRFRSDSHIKTAFAYIPHTKPEPPSVLRQLAYQEPSSLPGPESDPEGWTTLKRVHSRGLLLPNHPVNVQCTLSLATPLCYTRGTLIPCALKLGSTDENILDIFAEPTAIDLQLCRRVRYFCGPSELMRPEEIGWNEFMETMCTAIWWLSLNLEQNSSSRYLEGEIKLAEKLKPTSAMGHFSISYFVVLRPFKVPNFSSDDQDLLTDEVEIATVHAEGPRPHAYSDGPAHNQNARRPEVDYVTMLSGYGFNEIYGGGQ